MASLTEILTKHDNLLAILKEKCSLVDGREVTEESIYRDAESLFNLKHAGPKVKEIFDARAACAKKGVKAHFKTIVSEKIPKWFFGRASE